MKREEKKQNKIYVQTFIKQQHQKLGQMKTKHVVETYYIIIISRCRIYYNLSTYMPYLQSA